MEESGRPESKLAIGAVRAVSRLAWPSIGHGLARSLARRYCADSANPVTAAVRANQRVVSGGALSGAALDEAVLETLGHVGRCLYDLHHLPLSSAAVLARVRISPALEDAIARAAAGEPTVLAGVHTSNFDLAGRAFAALGLRPIVLTPPAPPGSNRVENELRERLGMRVLPTDMRALRIAAEGLAAGRAVVTGVDRPVPASARAVTFFGREARLPTVHVRLAAAAGLPVRVWWTSMAADGIYEVHGSEPVGMEAGRGAETVRRNAEAVLAVAERAIRETPRQWVMTHPVWPEAARELAATEREA